MSRVNIKVRRLIKVAASRSIRKPALVVLVVDAVVVILPCEVVIEEGGHKAEECETCPEVSLNKLRALFYPPEKVNPAEHQMHEVQDNADGEGCRQQVEPIEHDVFQDHGDADRLALPPPEQLLRLLNLILRGGKSGVQVIRRRRRHRTIGITT